MIVCSAAELFLQAAALTCQAIRPRVCRPLTGTGCPLGNRSGACWPGIDAGEPFSAGRS
jgi:hypothetical protein